MSLPGHASTIKAIVSDHVPEPMIGYDWLRDVGAIFDFGSNSLSLNGKSFKLRSKPFTGWVRRVVVERDTHIPSHCEYNVSARVEFSKLGRTMPESTSLWMTEAKELRQGVYLPRTLLPNRPSEVPIRVMNVSGAPIQLRAGSVITELCPAEAVVADLSQEEQVPADPEMEKVISDMVSRVDPSVSTSDRDRLNELLHEFTPVLSRNESDMGLTNVVMHRIDTGDAQPTRQQLRRQPKPAMEAIDQLVPEMLKSSLIEPSASPWAANVVLVKKKDGTARCCIDYRQLNMVTKKDRYPLPRTDACLDAMNGSKWFSTFDLRSAYHQVMINPDDKEKTNFICHRGSFQFRTMPFGLCNAGATFQRLMDVVLNGLSLQICLAYLDDVVVYSRDIDEHFVRLKQVFERLYAAGLKLKPSKCNVLQRQVTFLGHVMSADGIATDPQKIQAVAEWPVPTSIREVRAFVGLASYYRRFVKGFAEIATPLHSLTKKNAKFVWETEHQEAFERLKRALTEAPVLVTPDDEHQYVLATDASNHAMGAVLSMVVDGEERVVAYASRTFSRCQRNYCVTRRELLAVVTFLKLFKQYLLGRHFVVKTDHSALQWFRRSKEPVGQPGRWLEVMEEYDFDIEFCPGSKNGNADALSRRPCGRATCYCHDLEAGRIIEARQVRLGEAGQLADVFDFGFSREQVAKAQKEDKELSEIQELVGKGEPQPPWEKVATWTERAKSLWWQWPRLALRDSVLCRRWESPDGVDVRWQVVLPAVMRQEFMKQVHGGMVGGHLGRDKTLAQISRRAYWPTWKTDVLRYLKSCAQCAQYHRGGAPRQAALTPLVTGSPWERLSIDITGPHPRSRNGYQYMLTAVDHFTKWAEAIPLRDRTALSVAKALVSNVISRFGCPKQILSDQGPEFDGYLMTELCKQLRIDKVRTTAYKASTNGAVERFHRTLNSMLGKVVSDKQKDWDQWVPIVMAAYRASPHSATKMSPNRLVLGREVAMPIDVVLGMPGEEREPATSYENFADDLANRMEEAYSLARQSLNVAAERRKNMYDLRVRSKQFTRGQWVWYFCPRKFRGRSPKWQRLYSGPFLIVRVIQPSNYVIQRKKNGPLKVVHADKLKLWGGDPLPSWLEDSVVESGESVTEEREAVGTPVPDEAEVQDERAENGNAIASEAEHSDDADITPVGDPGVKRPARTRKLPSRLADYQM